VGFEDIIIFIHFPKAFPPKNRSHPNLRVRLPINALRAAVRYPEKG
jgi:hypothetical protein